MGRGASEDSQVQFYTNTANFARPGDGLGEDISHFAPKPAQVDHLRAVHLEDGNGRTACGRQSCDLRGIIDPGKVFLPRLVAGVKERS